MKEITSLLFNYCFVFLCILFLLFENISGQCPPIEPQSDVDPWQVRLPSSGFGGIEKYINGEFVDLYLSSPDHSTSIASRLDWGGSVVFFGVPGANVIDDNDTGRELQMALYDPDRFWQPCACNASCQDNPAASCPGGGISFLGWDPVQGGDKCGNGSPVNYAGQIRNDTMQVIVSPIMWNADWDSCTCQQTPCSELQPASSDIILTMEFRYISEFVVEVMLEIENLANMSHGIDFQEFPTIYVSNGANGSPDLPILINGNGSQLTIPIISDGVGYLNFNSTTPYVSFQNEEQNYGIGLLMDQGLNKFQAWSGDGENGDAYWHNLRTLIQFGIPALSTIRGLSYVAVGDFPNIQKEFQKIISSRPPFGEVTSPSPPFYSTHYYSYGEGITVEGWVLDNTEGSTIKIFIDGNIVSTLSLTVARNDICEIYPEYVGCPYVGYSGTVSTTGLSKSCSHLIRVIASDYHGNDSFLGDRIIAFNN